MAIFDAAAKSLWTHSGESKVLALVNTDVDSIAEQDGDFILGYEESSDDLGPLKGLLIAIDDGPLAVLYEHADGSRPQAVYVRVDQDFVNVDTYHKLLRTLQLGPQRVTWAHPWIVSQLDRIERRRQPSVRAVYRCMQAGEQHRLTVNGNNTNR